MASHSNRPVSPHLQVYKLPLTGIISISHRMTGVFLSAGLVFFVYLLSAIAGGIESYDALQSLMNNWLVKFIIWGFIGSLFFHCCHGVRHLIWDAGRSFAKETLDYYAKIELAVAGALTLFTFLFL
ncbi:MAG: succinate dehydrogenase, cytochrome b556 subunit [Methylococcaceae bacterium]